MKKNAKRLLALVLVLALTSTNMVQNLYALGSEYFGEDKGKHTNFDISKELKLSQDTHDKGIYDLSLRVDGKSELIKSKIVLIFDKSGSMKDEEIVNAKGYEKIVAAKEASKKFAQTLIDSDAKNTELAVLSFAKKEDEEFLNFSKDKVQINNFIQNIKTKEGKENTDLYSAIELAISELNIAEAKEKTIDPKIIVKKHIVIVSDGNPTDYSKIKADNVKKQILDEKVNVYSIGVLLNKNIHSQAIKLLKEISNNNILDGSKITEFDDVYSAISGKININYKNIIFFDYLSDEFSLITEKDKNGKEIYGKIFKNNVYDEKIEVQYATNSRFIKAQVDGSVNGTVELRLKVKLDSKYFEQKNNKLAKLKLLSNKDNTRVKLSSDGDDYFPLPFVKTKKIKYLPGENASIKVTTDPATSFLYPAGMDARIKFPYEIIDIKPGYKFEAWVDEDGKEYPLLDSSDPKYDSENLGFIEKISKNKTLKAKTVIDIREKIPYEIKFYVEEEKDGKKVLRNLGDDKTIKKEVLIAKPIVEKKDIINIEKNRPKGYKLSEITPNLPFDLSKEILVAGSSEIKVIYKKDQNLWKIVKFVAGNGGKLGKEKAEFLVNIEETLKDQGVTPPSTIAGSGYTDLKKWSPDFIEANKIKEDTTYVAMFNEMPKPAPAPIPAPKPAPIPAPAPKPVKEEVIIVDKPAPQAKLDYENHFAYIQGYPDGSVQPSGNITREEVAAVFFRLLDKEYRETIRENNNKFSDVDETLWSNKHISTLTKGKIITGYTDGTFKPHRNITRAELAIIASKFSIVDENAVHNFSDLDGHWAEKHIASAVSKGWVKGYNDRTYRPDRFITRAEFVTLVNNVQGRRVHQKDILKNSRKFTDLEQGKWYFTAMKAATNSYLYEKMADSYQKWTKLITPNIEM